MKKEKKIIWVGVVVMVVGVGVVMGQWFRRGYIDEDNPRAAFERRGIEFPDWEASPEMPTDVFTFARLRYRDGGYRRRGGSWDTDYPDSDLNFSYRLQELTSLEVDPDGKIVDIDAEELAEYPWVYMIEPGDIILNDEEAKILRDYMMNGGFIMVDDFWGAYEYDRFYQALKKIFPEREPRELPIEHPVFHFVFELKEKPQVPAINAAMSGYTYEFREGDSGRDVSYQGVFDDKGRMMMIICHNTDLGDGWEREGENEYYFKTFSEPLSFPMGINIVFYALTH
ncbi:MAG: DUF4159 domain-containing protein [Verrucomicrobiota bacterium]